MPRVVSPSLPQTVSGLLGGVICASETKSEKLNCRSLSLNYFDEDFFFILSFSDKEVKKRAEKFHYRNHLHFTETYLHLLTSLWQIVSDLHIKNGQ